MNNFYLNIDNHRCYMGDSAGFGYNIICVDTYEYNTALAIANRLKEVLDANGFMLHRIGYPECTIFGKEVMPTKYGITITGVRMEEIMKWQGV